MPLYNKTINRIKSVEDEDKKIGSEFMDQVVESLNSTWNLLNDETKNNVMEATRMLGDSYQEARKFKNPVNPLNLPHNVGATGARVIEGIGYASDKTIGEGVRFLGDKGNIDPRLTEIGAIAAQIYGTPKAIKGATNLVNKGIASPQAHNFMYKAGQIADDALGSFKPASQRTINLKEYSAILDDINSIPSEEFAKIVRLAKQPGINSMTLARRFNQQQGIISEYLKKFDKPPADFKGMMDESKAQPPENFSGITPPTYAQARQKINRAIGNDVYVRHEDGAPRFDFVKLQNNKVFTSEYKRLIGSDISTIDDFGLSFAPKRRNVQYESRKAAFTDYRRELMNQYLEWYGPAMKRLNISPSQIDLDHRLTLIQSLGIYHNVDPKSQLWIDIQNAAVKRGIYPGDAKRNLDLADPESHRVKSNYFNDLHGLKTHGNMKYWKGQHRNTGKTRLEIMEQSHLGPEYEKAHLEVVNDYFDVVERGNRILDSARAMWHAENMKGILPEEIVNTLMKVSVDPKYNTKQLDNTVKAMMDVEIDKYRKFQRLFEIEEELDLINASPETILDTDPQDIKDLKKEWRKLNTVRKSKWFKRHYESMMKVREKELIDPQRNIFELVEFLYPND